MLFPAGKRSSQHSPPKKLQAKKKRLSQVCRRFSMMSEALWPDFLNSVFTVLT